MSSVPGGFSIADSHEVVFFKRSNGLLPGFEYLSSCPLKVRAQFHAILEAVSKAPPSRFSGGGYWQAMHGELSGWFEVRINKSSLRKCFRLFCLLDYNAQNSSNPYLVVVTGITKPVETKISEREYMQVSEMGVEYFSENPRSVS